MNRDPELLKMILVAASNASSRIPIQMLEVPDGTDDATLWRHLKYLITEGWIDGQILNDSPLGFVIHGTSPGADDFLHYASSPDLWAKAIGNVKAKGLPVTMAVLNDLLCQAAHGEMTNDSIILQLPSQMNEVFVVHGRDESVREKTARFLEKLGLKPIILHEQPNKGRTIIEKFSDYSNVGFAVVLMTGDDQGGTVGNPIETQRKRARQNVILELGFFLGKLGRSRVCALYQDDVEMPSDYNGVLFVKLDPAGHWQFELAKELRAAGFDIDLNNL